MNIACNGGCCDFRPHADEQYVVCTKCGEIYHRSEVTVDLSIDEDYEYEKDGGFDHLST